MRPPRRSPLSLVFRTPTHLGSAPPVALFGRNLGLLGPWALVGEGGNRPGGADWHGDYSPTAEGAEPRGGRWGLRRRRSSGFMGTCGEMVTWGSGGTGEQRKWRRAEYSDRRVTREQGYMGSTRLMRAPA